MRKRILVLNKLDILKTLDEIMEKNPLGIHLESAL